MIAYRQFLLCDDELHAEVVDTVIMSRLVESDGNRGTRWSGVYTNGTQYGVLWANPASALFGVPITDDPVDGDPSVVLATESEAGEWTEVVPEPVEEVL